MGQSADARLGWAVALTQTNEDFPDDRFPEPFDVDAFEEAHNYGWMDELFGFSMDEHGPKYDGLDSGTPEFKAEAKAFWERRNTMVPVEIEYDGTSECYGENTPFLILKRNSWAYDYGSVVVEPETLREPSEHELAAIQKVLDHIGFTGNRDVKLYLIASYG